LDAEHPEEVVGDINAVAAQLIARQLHTGHLHDPQKAGGGGQHIRRKLADGGSKLVHLGDAGGGKLGQCRRVLRLGHFRRELGHGLGHPLTDQKTGRKARDEGEQHGQKQQLLHPLGKGEEGGGGHDAHQTPVLPVEGGVSAVNLQRNEGSGVRDAVLGKAEAVRICPRQFEGSAEIQPAAVHHRKRCEREGVCIEGGARIAQGVTAGIGCVQLVVGHFFGQIAGQKLYAHHAVNGAVRQDEGEAVGDGLTVIAVYDIGAGGPVAVGGGIQLGFRVIGGLERRVDQPPCAEGAVGDGGLPRLIRGDVLGLHQSGGGALEHQVRVIFRRRRVGVKIPQVDGGQPVAAGPPVQVVGVQDEEDARHRLGAQGRDQIGGDGRQQGVSRIAAAVQRGKVDGTTVQQFLRQGVDPAGQGGKLLRIVQLGLDVAAAGLYLHGKDILGILVQLRAHLHEVDGCDQQQNFDEHHQHHGVEDGAEDGTLAAFLRRGALG